MSSSVPGPGLLSRSLSRVRADPGSHQQPRSADIIVDDVSGGSPGEREDLGVFGKFATSPSPAISHAMHIPSGFRAPQPQSFPIIGSMGRSMVGSLPFGSLPMSSGIGSLAYGRSPEAIRTVPPTIHTTPLLSYPYTTPHQAGHQKVPTIPSIGFGAVGRVPMGASPPATEAEGLAAPLLINQRNRISIDERWPDDEEAPVQQQQYNKATCLTHPYSQQQQQSQLQPENDGGTLRALVFGGINTLVGLPALIAFATIVFQAPMYGPYIGSLCKFFFFASAVHQIVFCLFSSLPFAVGQVQDVGLIFLSAMATDIASICLEAQIPANEALGTSLFTFCVATLIVGLLTMLVGKYRMAQLVQYVPLPVVGGYLGYVGYFCVAGGTSLAAGVELNKVVQWLDVLHIDPLLKTIPLVITTVILILTMEHFKHPLVLPGVLAAIPLFFHGVLLAAGLTLEQAQEAGWAMKPTVGSQYFWDLWGLFNIQTGSGWSGMLSGIYFPAFIAQLPKISGLFLVVCFGSCMDVAAIQQDVPRPLDFNGELVTVGLSNIITSLCGAGFTGSYIFSQTVFTLRAGVLNRLNGWVVVVLELTVFAVPFSVVQYCPNFFFGALLVWFGVDILTSWMFHSFFKLSKAEYALLWITFMAIMYTGLEAGIVLGIIMATLYFAYEYSQSTVSTLNPVPAVSGAMHGYAHQALVETLMPRKVSALALSGFAFFGNSISISTKVEKFSEDLISTAHSDSMSALEAFKSEEDAERPPVTSANNAGLTMRMSSIRRKTIVRKAVTSMTDAPLFVILDFRLVPSMDATAARTFATLANSLYSRGIQVIISGISSDAIRSLLTAQGLGLVYPEAALDKSAERSVTPHRGEAPLAGGHLPATIPEGPQTDIITDGVNVVEMLSPGQAWDFPSLQAAARYCEHQFLDLAVSRGLIEPARTLVTLEEVLEAHASQLPQSQSSSLIPVAATLKRHITHVLLSRGQTLFKAGESVDSLFIVESGRLVLEAPSRVEGNGGNGGTGGHAGSVRVMEFGPGCLVGAQDFYLARPAATSAFCRSSTCRIMALSRVAFGQLMNEAPAALTVLQFAVTRSLSLAETTAC